MLVVSSSATANSAGRAPTTPMTSQRRRGSTSKVPPDAPWRSSTRQAGSSSSPTTISEEPAHEKRDGAGPQRPQAHHPPENHPPRSDDVSPISLDRAVPYAAVGLRRANRAARGAFDTSDREPPACGPCDAEIGCVGLRRARGSGVDKRVHTLCGQLRRNTTERHERPERPARKERRSKACGGPWRTACEPSSARRGVGAVPAHRPLPPHRCRCGRT